MVPRIVLGFCAEIATTDYTFAYVMAAGHEGRLLKADFSMFPPQGSIYVPRSLFPHLPVRFRDLGFWDVEEDPNFNERNRGAKYRAFRLRPDVPAELLRIDCPSHRPDEARQFLLERGLESFYRLDGRDLLLEFADGVMVGPVRLEPAEADGRYRCDPERLAEPLGAWPNRNALQPVLVSMGQTIRWFVWPLPRPDSFIDLASTRQVLENLQRLGVSQELYDDLIGRLGSVDHAVRIPPLHRRRLQTLLDEALQTGKRLEECVPLLRTDPKVQEAIEQYKHQIGEEHRLELEKLKTQLGDEVEELRAKKSGVEAEIEAARQRLADEEAQKGKDSGGDGRGGGGPRPPGAAGGQRGCWPRWPCCGRSWPTAPPPAGRGGDGRNARRRRRGDAAARPGRRLCAPEKSTGERRPPAALGVGRRARDPDSAVAGPGRFLPGVVGAGAGANRRPGPVGGAMDRAGRAGRPERRHGDAADPGVGCGRGTGGALAARRQPLLHRRLRRRPGSSPGPAFRRAGSGAVADGAGRAVRGFQRRAARPGADGPGADPAHGLPRVEARLEGPTGPARPDDGQPLAAPRRPRRGRAGRPPRPAAAGAERAVAAQRAGGRPEAGGLAGRGGRPDALDAVLFAWVLPRCLAAGVDLSDHGDAFRQLFPEPDEMDPRLQLLLKAHGAAEVF